MYWQQIMKMMYLPTPAVTKSICVPVTCMSYWYQSCQQVVAVAVFWMILKVVLCLLVFFATMPVLFEIAFAIQPYIFHVRMYAEMNDNRKAFFFRRKRRNGHHHLHHQQHHTLISHDCQILHTGHGRDDLDTPLCACTRTSQHCTWAVPSCLYSYHQFVLETPAIFARRPFACTRASAVKRRDGWWRSTRGRPGHFCTCKPVRGRTLSESLPSVDKFTATSRWQ